MEFDRREGAEQVREQIKSGLLNLIDARVNKAYVNMRNVLVDDRHTVLCGLTASDVIPFAGVETNVL